MSDDGSALVEVEMEDSRRHEGGGEAPAQWTGYTLRWHGEVPAQVA
jgi:hypothetical protein